MNTFNNDGYSTPVESDDQESPLVTPPTPRHRKRTLGVTRMPSNLAMPDFDDNSMETCSGDDDDIPFLKLRPRTDSRDFITAALLVSAGSTRARRMPLLSRTAIEARVDSSIANKRPRYHRCDMRASLAHRENVRAARLLPSRSDSCDW